MTLARLRPLAEVDLVERARYYSAEGGTDLGVRFFDAAVASLRCSCCCCIVLQTIHHLPLLLPHHPRIVDQHMQRMSISKNV